MLSLLTLFPRGTSGPTPDPTRRTPEDPYLTCLRKGGEGAKDKRHFRWKLSVMTWSTRKSVLM